MYHYIETVPPNDENKQKLSTDPYEFEREVRELVDGGYIMYFAKDIPQIMRGQYPQVKQGIVLTFDDGYEDFYTVVWPILKKYRVKGTVFVINNYLGRKGFLTPDQVRELALSPYVEIGAHTLNHVSLAQVSDEVAKNEIEESKQGLEELIQRPVSTFAYPFGSHNLHTPRIVKEASFSAAFTTQNSTLIQLDSLTTIPRVRSGHLVVPKLTEALERLLKIGASAPTQ